MFPPEVSEKTVGFRLGIEVVGGDRAEALRLATEAAAERRRVLSREQPIESQSGLHAKRFFAYAEKGQATVDDPIKGNFRTAPSMQAEKPSMEEIEHAAKNADRDELRRMEQEFAADADERGLQWDAESEVWIDGDGNQYDRCGRQL